MAYKRELIINNGSLTSYKKLLKVSDVCQLLDKRTYEPTHTTSGVVYTNNGDGTITVNSLNITANTYDIIAPTIYAKKGHKYCVPLTASYSGGYFYVQINNGKDAYVAEINNDIYESPADNYHLVPRIVAYLNSPQGDKTYKPQLFDLTEMYGAGNEPATVAEFKAKFPNELYDYSPRCWVTSYKTGLIAETKNLFNLATASVGYIDWEGKLNHSEDTITYSLSSDYLECTPNTSYTISAFCGKHPVIIEATLWCRIAYYDENKQLLDGPSKSFTDTNIDYISATWTVPTNAKYLRATTRWMSPTYREQHPENWVMLEKGSVATDYVPYGYL